MEIFLIVVIALFLVGFLFGLFLGFATGAPPAAD